MSIWNLIEGGNSQPLTDTWGRRFSCRVGRWIASRRKGVTVDPTARVSPEARICARGQSIVIGPDTLVAQGAMLQGTVTLGRNCSVQPYTILTGYKDAGITVGENVRIASHCMMVAGNHRFDDPNRPICQQGLETKPIVIEDDVWVASRVNIMAGVRIGRGSVLAAGAVVTKDVPPMSVVAGVPARVIKKRGEVTPSISSATRPSPV